MSKNYKVQCDGEIVTEHKTEALAIEKAKRVGLARCLEAQVIAPSGKIVYEF